MSRTRDEDLFAESTMTIPEHLEELRVTLVKALLSLAVGFLIALFYAGNVVDFIRRPLDAALEDYYMQRSVELVEQEYHEAVARGESVPNLTIMREAVARERMIPHEIWIDPQALLAEIGEGLDELPGDMPLPPPKLIVPADIVDMAGFARAVVGQSQAEPPSPGKRLWSLLGEVGPASYPPQITPADPATSSDATINGEPPPDSAGDEVEGTESDADPPEDNPTPAPSLRTASQAAFEKLAAGETLDESEQQSVFAGLNAVVRRPDFYDPESFAKILDDSRGLLGLLRTSKQENLRELVEQREQLRGYEMSRMNTYLIDDSFAEFQLSGRLRAMIRLLQWTPVGNDPRTGVQTLSVTEAFVVYLKAALMFGLVLSSPLVFYFIWDFVASGLYPHERRYIYIFLPFSLALFLAGAAIAFFFVFQFVLKFLFEFNAIINAKPNIRMSEWLGFAMLLPVGFGIAFQLPLVMLFLARIGVFTVESYYQYWRPAIMVIAVMSMLLTPADPGSMLIMFCSLTPLYYLGIQLCKWWPATRNPFDEPAEV